EVPEHFIEQRLVVASDIEQADLEILEHGQLRKYFAPLRDIADAGASAHVGRGMGNILAIERDVSRTSAQETHEANHLAGVNLHAQIAQDLGFTIGDREIVDVEHNAIVLTSRARQEAVRFKHQTLVTRWSRATIGGLSGVCVCFSILWLPR